MSDLLALADRVEKLTGPCRDTDADVAEHVSGWKYAHIAPDYDGQNASDILTPNGKPFEGFAYPNRGKIHRAYHAPDYTRDCRDAAFPKDSVRKQLAAALRARANGSAT